MMNEQPILEKRRCQQNRETEALATVDDLLVFLVGATGYIGIIVPIHYYENLISAT